MSMRKRIKAYFKQLFIKIKQFFNQLLKEENNMEGTLTTILNFVSQIKAKTDSRLDTKITTRAKQSSVDQLVKIATKKPRDLNIWQAKVTDGQERLEVIESLGGKIRAIYLFGDLTPSIKIQIDGELIFENNHIITTPIDNNNLVPDGLHFEESFVIELKGKNPTPNTNTTDTGTADTGSTTITPGSGVNILGPGIGGSAESYYYVTVVYDISQQN